MTKHTNTTAALIIAREAIEAHKAGRTAAAAELSLAALAKTARMFTDEDLSWSSHERLWRLLCPLIR